MEVYDYAKLDDRNDIFDSFLAPLCPQRVGQVVRKPVAKLQGVSVRYTTTKISPQYNIPPWQLYLNVSGIRSRSHILMYVGSGKHHVILQVMDSSITLGRTEKE